MRRQQEITRNQSGYENILRSMSIDSMSEHQLSLLKNRRKITSVLSKFLSRDNAMASS